MNGDGERLEESGGIERHAVRDLVAPIGGVIDPILKGALVVGEGLGAAPESQLLAEVVSALAAGGTLAAGNADLKRDPVTDLEALDFRPNGNDNTRGLVAKREGLTSTKITIGKLFVVANIGAADAGLLDGDLELTNTRVLDRSCLLY
jgi:hypothetical protein